MIFEEDRPQLKEIHGSRECYEHGKRLRQPQRALGVTGLDLPCEQFVQAFSECRNRPFPNAETSFSRAFQPTTEQRDTPFRHAETPSTDKRDVLPRGGAPEVRQGCRESNTEQPQFSAANRAA